MESGQLNNELISVIVPVYNTEKYLCKCVQSIQQQTYHNLEIILVDDGSTDGSGKLCDELAEQDERIHVIHQKNQGLSSARNSGIEVAKGEYLGFIDSDDYIYCDMYRVLHQILTENNADIAVAGIRVTRELEFFKNIKYTNFHRNDYYGERALLQLFENYTNAVSACNKLYKKKMFQNIVYPIGKKHEDEYITYRLLYVSNKVIFIDEEMYAYVQREGSIVHSMNEKSCLDKIEAYYQIIKFCKEKQLIRSYQKAVYRYLDFKKDYYEYCAKHKKEQKKAVKNAITREARSFSREFRFDNKNQVKRIMFDFLPNVFVIVKNIVNKREEK